MKSFKLILIVVVLSMALLVSGAAFADRHPGGGGHPGGHYVGPRGYYGGPRGYYGGYYRRGLDVWFGWPGWNYPYNYPYSPYYYPPAVRVPSSPQEYIELPQGADDSTPSGIWYYCPESKSYLISANLPQRS